jgi:hypothetical protein
MLTYWIQAKSMYTIGLCAGSHDLTGIVDARRFHQLGPLVAAYFEKSWLKAV